MRRGGFNFGNRKTYISYNEPDTIGEIMFPIILSRIIFAIEYKIGHGWISLTDDNRRELKLLDKCIAYLRSHGELVPVRSICVIEVATDILGSIDKIKSTRIA